MRPSSTPSLPPDTICGYVVVRSPAPATYLAFADGGRQVLLKPLDTDCLLHGQLHPSIKERLSRVRELALKSAANLHGVERDASGVYLVWEFIEGRSLEATAAALSPSQLTSLMREAVLSVEALHQVGIVHGALHARNVIIDLANRPRLTHISPLLFHDPAVDEAAMNHMLVKLIEHRTDIDPALRATLQRTAPLRELASSLIATDVTLRQATLIDTDDRSRRRRMLFSAVFVAAFGVLLTVFFAIASRWF